MKTVRMIVSMTAVACGLLVTQSAFAGAHTWRITEAFSNSDGTIQYIELQESMGGTSEMFLNGLQVTSQSTGHAFTFPANLSGNTANRHLLLGTSAYAALPGAAPPDYPIPAGFFNRNGDTLKYAVYDTWAVGALPTDCTSSFNHVAGSTVTGDNSPTNYAGTTGHINVCPACVGDTNGSHTVDIDDVVNVITHWGQSGSGVPGDADNSGTVNIDDLVTVITHWGAACP